jgi:hypothetical protein
VIRRVVATLVPLLFLSAAWALDEPKDKADKPAKSEAAEKLKDIQQEMQKARTDLQARFAKAEKDEEKAEIRKEMAGLTQKFAKQYLDLAEQHPKDPVAAQALVQVLMTGRGTPEAAKAADLIVKNRIYEPAVIQVLPMVTRMGAPYAERMLRGAAEHAKSNDDRGRATFALAQFVKDRAERARGDAAKKLEAEAEKLFETVMEKYADVKSGRGTLGAAAKPELFEMKNLAIGKTAPDIEGEDVDGVKFKLSDYRGKVVMLDFWGHW